ncbi:unnamed protein product [Fraxinus pennsylvanica]|uniref:Ubiquitin conjugation factor E4 core domain-containing protein n=1 Tax=Fraxinus pennsylvanica TaxID=56036 RepID=A0AAD2A5N7_9LAMI|nr:unnamed protein product [Fraxinus pennsylvanica]
MGRNQWVVTNQHNRNRKNQKPPKFQIENRKNFTFALPRTTPSPMGRRVEERGGRAVLRRMGRDACVHGRVSFAHVELIEPAVKGTLNVDPKYVFDSNRLELRWEISLGTMKADVSANNSDGENRLLKYQEATSLGSKANEVSLLQSNRPMSSCSQKAKYPFICECFFMMASVLNLGLLKAFSDFKNLVQQLEELQAKYEGQVQQCSDLSNRLDATEKDLKQTSELLANTENELRQCKYSLKEREFIISEQKKAARGDKLNADNMSTVYTFQAELVQQLGTLCNTLATSISYQSEHLQCVENLCNSFLEVHDKVFVSFHFLEFDSWF